jgi:antitoxin HicB
MKPYTYPASFEPQAEGGFTVLFSDVPEGITEGDTRAEALLHAVGALETGLSFYVDSRKPLPKPSKPKRGQAMVEVSPLAQAKLALYDAMRARKMGKAELARRLDCHLMQIDRLLDLCHASKLEQVAKALAALGKRIVIDVRDAA